MSPTLVASNFLRVESQWRKSGGPRNVLVYKCSVATCDTEIKVRLGDSHSGMCNSHSHQKRPFESIYNGLFNDWRRLNVSLTYDEFIEFTKIPTCHYCDAKIDWIPYSIDKGAYKSRAYDLDRIDISIGYTKDNCVVCCTDCNILRGDRFTYEEFLKLAPILKDIRLSRGS